MTVPDRHTRPSTRAAGFPAVGTVSMTNRARLLALGSASLLLGSACGDTAGPRVPSAIQLAPGALALEIGDTARLTASLIDQRGAAFSTLPPGTQIFWSSSDQNVALVQNGLVLGVGAGSALIQAAANGIDPASITVAVTSPVLTGEIGFDYSGHRSGAFDVSSTFTLLPSGASVPSFVVTFHDPDWNTQDIFAWREHADGTVDIVWFWVSGEVTAPVVRDLEDGFIIFGYNGPNAPAGGVYGATGGSVTFSAVTDGRQFDGTFSLQLRDNAENALAVSNGSFSAPRVPAFLILSSEPASASVENGDATSMSRGVRAAVELRQLRRQALPR
jgi:hypothetical protein